MKKTILIVLGVVGVIGIAVVAFVVYKAVTIGKEIMNSDVVNTIEETVEESKNANTSTDSNETSDSSNTKNINSQGFYLYCPEEWIEDSGDGYWSCANPVASSAGISNNIMLSITETSVVPSNKADCAALGASTVADINSEDGDLPTTLVSSSYVTAPYKSCNLEISSTSGETTVDTYERYVESKDGKMYVILGMYDASDTDDFMIIKSSVDGFIIK